MKILSKLLQHIDYLDIIGNEDQKVDFITDDSRKVRDGSMFIAVEGYVSDGHNYINDAIDAGACTIVCNKIPNSELSKSVTFIITEDSRKQGNKLAQAFYDFPSEKMKIIGITGTNGKTTTAYQIFSLLKILNQQSAYIGTIGILSGNNRYESGNTTPGGIQLANIMAGFVEDGIQYLVMEVSSHSLVQNRLAGVLLDIAIFTNLTPEHLDFHKDMNGYASAKKIIFTLLKTNGIGIINSDSEWAYYMSSSQVRSVLVGTNDKADIKVIAPLANSNGISFKIDGYHFESGIMGYFNIENSMLSLVAMKNLGFSYSDLIHPFSKFQGVEGRMQRVLLPNGAYGVIDYAHTPDALLSLVKAIKALSDEHAKIVLVFGCGGDRDVSKRKQMGAIAKDFVDFSVVTSDNPRTENPLRIIDQIVIGFDKAENFAIEVDRKKAIADGYLLTRKNDWLVIAGKGHENYQVIGNEKVHFSDKEVLKSLS